MAWNQFSLPGTADNAALVSPVVAVSRKPSNLEVVWIAFDGSLQGAYWNDGGEWTRYSLPITVEASVFGGVAVVSRIPTSLEVWYIGVDGSVHDWNWYEGVGWNTFRIADGGAAPDGGIVAVSRIASTMELWYVREDGALQDHNWYSGVGWNTFELPGSGGATGQMAVVSRIPSSMELWSVGVDGSVRDHFWYEGSQWETFELASPGSASVSGGIAVVSRIHESMELWYVGADGSVRDHYWYEGLGWSTFELAGAESASLNTGIAAVSRFPTTMAVWYVAPDASVQGRYWYQCGTWDSWDVGDDFQIANPGSASESCGLAAVSRLPTTMEVWCVAHDGSLLDANWYQPAQWTVPQPPGLGFGAINYYLVSGCDNLTCVSVTIDITDEVVGSLGVGFQLNCNSAQGGGPNAPAFQQYCFSLRPGTSDLNWIINCFLPADTGSGASIRQSGKVATVPGTLVPAGYALTITLGFDAHGNVNGATFIVVDDLGVVSQASTNPLPAVAPIVAFQLDIVGWAQGAGTTLSSGAGSIVYTAGTPLSPVGPPPPCIDGWHQTVEDANVLYGALPSGPSNLMIQTFQPSEAVIPPNQGGGIQMGTGGGLKTGPGGPV
jgi:hypothetical protein